jgi:type I restriction enzyme, S subunit
MTTRSGSLRDSPGDVDHVPLRDVGTWYGGGTPSKAVNEYWANGSVPWLSPKDMDTDRVLATQDHISDTALARSALKLVPAGSVAFVVRSNVLRRRFPVAMVPFPVTLNQDMRAVVPHENILSEYLALVCRARAGAILDLAGRTDGSMAAIRSAEFLNYRIPVPPLDIQRDLVRILAEYATLEAELEVELEAELEARRRQYRHYLDLLLKPQDQSLPWVTLGEVGRVCMCKRIFKDQTAPVGEIPFYKIGTFGGDPDAFISRDIYEDYRARYPFPNEGDILLSAAGTIGRAVPYDGREAYFQDSNIVWIDNNETVVLNRFLYYQYQVISWSTDGGTIRRLYNDNLRRARIPIPPLQEQARVVAILDDLEMLVTDASVCLPAELAARRKQYEHYRDRLLTFEEAL